MPPRRGYGQIFGCSLAAVLLADVLLAWGGIGAAPAQEGAAAGDRASPKAGEVYANLQVLRGAPADQLVPAMEFVSASLGVPCEHCHVLGAFEKDDKPAKAVAREMMRMVEVLNRASFDGRREVTCFSCHRGVIEPAVEPPPVAPSTAPAPTVPSPLVPTAEPSGEPARAASQPAKEATEPLTAEGLARPAETAESAAPPAAEVFARHAAAAGGADALRRVESRVGRGTVTLFGGREYPLEVFQRSPARHALVMHLPGGDNVFTYDGARGAVEAPGRPVRPMTGSEVVGAVLANDFHWAAQPERVFAASRVVGRRRIGEAEVLVVEARVEGHPVELSFDVASGLLRRTLSWTETPLGRLPTQVDLAEYRAVLGLRTPVAWTVSRPQGRYRVRLSQVEANAAIDEGRFAPPRIDFDRN